MNVLVVGSGGREHALAWKLRQSSKVETIYVAPGNAGTAVIGENINARTSEEILKWLAQHKVDLVVIGPDTYLAEGIIDSIRELGITAFGPTKAAAEIEWSKSYAKQFMQEEGIPTARHRVFSTPEGAREYACKQRLPIVIKADGLAAGKGVIIAKSLAEADSAIEDIMGIKKFGNAGNSIVIEDFLEGIEISIHAFCDGEDFLLFPTAKDYKRAFDGDMGPNTGGMGTIAPVPIVDARQMELIRERIILPTLLGLKKRARPFSGVLYPGIMLTRDGPMVIEFNARFGDPETQSYMRLLKTDLVDILHACATGALKNIDIKWNESFAACVVLASKGYPAAYEKGIEITGLPIDSSDIVVFHAGTAQKNGKLVTDGGRVLNITATGETLEQALKKAYEAIKSINFEGMHYRKDIGTSP